MGDSALPFNKKAAGRPGFPGRPAFWLPHGPANVAGRIANGIPRVTDRIARAAGQIACGIANVIHHPAASVGTAPALSADAGAAVGQTVVIQIIGSTGTAALHGVISIGTAVDPGAARRAACIRPILHTAAGTPRIGAVLTAGGTAWQGQRQHKGHYQSKTSLFHLHASYRFITFPATHYVPYRTNYKLKNFAFFPVQGSFEGRNAHISLSAA